MAFDESNLHRDERIVLDTHPHWGVMFKAIVAVVISVGLGVWVLQIDRDGVFNTVLTAAVGILILVSLGYLVQRWVAWVSTSFVITTDRCIYRNGIVAKHGIEIPLDRINTVFFRQGLVERVGKAGTLTIESAGENGTQTFRNISDPIGVQQVLYQAIEDNENRKFDRVAGGGAQVSVADELAKLVDLHHTGHLSDEEFDAQRARLLGQ